MKRIVNRTMRMAKGYALLIICLMCMSSLNAKDYGFKIGGFNVTSDNYQNIKPNGLKQGKVTYDPSSNTVTLNNVVINRTGSGYRAILNTGCEGLTIVLIGCTLTADDAAPVKLETNTSIYVKGENIIEGKDEDAIYMEENNSGVITLDIYGDPDATLYITATNSCAIKGKIEFGGARHDVFFYDPTVIIEGKKGDLVNVDATFNYNVIGMGGKEPEGYVALYPTNNSNYPNVINSSITLTETEIPTVIIEPWEAKATGKTITYSNGTAIYQDLITITNRYSALLTEHFFPDKNFRDYLYTIFKKYFLYDSDLEKPTTIDVTNKSISSLKGIEYFTNLTELKCGTNKLTSLDLSKNTKLTKLYCGSNQLNTLTGIGSNITTIECNNNKLTSLDITGRANLTTLNCSNNTLLKTLNCYNNALTTLTFTSCSALETLNCYNNKLKSLNFSGCTGLKTINCSSNLLQEMLEITGRSNLTTLNCSNNTKLDYLNCANNALTSLDVKGCSNLVQIWCDKNNFTELTITQLSKLDALSCTDNTSLKKLYCYKNAISGEQLLVYGCTALEDLRCYENKLTTIDLKDCTKLSSLMCYANNMTNMDELISSLYDRKNLSTKGALRGIYPNMATERNVITKKNVRDASQKGWKIYYFDNEWALYEGSGIDITTGIAPIDNNTDDATPLYNLSGQRVDNNYKGIVVKKNKKVINR